MPGQISSKKPQEISEDEIFQPDFGYGSVMAYITIRCDHSSMQTTERVSMGKHLANILAGARDVLRLYPEWSYKYPTKGEFRKDRDAIRGDLKEIAKDLEKGVQKYDGYTLSHK